MTLFGNANQKVRPLRLAFLVEPNNKTQVRESIRIASTIWGGTYCPIVPLYKAMPRTWHEAPLNVPKAESVITGYLDAFDPDVLVQFPSEVPSLVKDYGAEIIRPDAIWKDLPEGRTLAPKYAIGIFEMLRDVFDKHFKYKAKYPPKLVHPSLPEQLQLFWASVLGEWPADIVSLVKRHFYDAVEITDTAFTTDQLPELLKGDVVFPRRLAGWGLEKSRRSWRRNAYGFFLDANKLEDIIDYWNLRALGADVLPIPKQLQTDKALLTVAEEFFRDHRIPWPHNKAVCDQASIIRSRNSTMEELQAFAKALPLAGSADDPSDSPFFVLQHWYPRIWDEWAREKDGAVPADIHGEEEETVEIRDAEHPKFSLKPRLPSFADKYAYHGGFRCANDISFHIYGSSAPLAEVFPRAAGQAFLRAIAGRYRMHDDWRVSRGNVARLVKNEVADTWEVPAAEEVMFGWLEDRGWKAELSPPGRLGKQMYGQLGGFLSALKDETLLGVLEHMNGGTVQANSQPAKTNRIGQPREIPVGELRNRLRNEKWPGRQTLKYLIGQGVFRAGLSLQCPHCVRGSWYEIASIDETFSCPLCLNKFPAIGNVESATWSYRTAGPFSVPRYADGAFATLLAIAFFSDHSLPTFQATPTLSFVAKAPDKANLEADFALFWQQSMFGERVDGLVFGECKTYGSFEDKDYARMRHFAKTFPGAVLAFVTLRKELTPKEIQAIKRIARAGHKYWKADRPINPVLILTARELLSDVGPPYCWRETESDRRFEHTRGLVDVCDVTQQLYLGMTSWRKEWSEKPRRRGKTKAAAPSGPDASA